MSGKTFSIVSSQESKIEPYPFVYVEDSGAYRELSIEDKQYLEEKFDPTDSNRPYVKSRYNSKTPDGKMSGFLRRTKLPKGLIAGELPKNKKW
jgi:hypothetical protein